MAAVIAARAAFAPCPASAGADLDSCLTMLPHAWQVKQHCESGGSFDKSADC